jgi:hypothetical protein
MACHYLFKYPKESDLERTFDLSRYWSRNLVWDMVERIRTLKREKIVWPDDLGGNGIWVGGVDCTMTATVEYEHPVLSQNPDIFGYKVKRAAQNFELVLALDAPQLIWMNGPFDGGLDTDLTILRNKGLKDRLKALGKKVIGDGIYKDECCTRPNSHHSKSVAKFVSRVLKRTEHFNKLVKEFDITSGVFHHSKSRLASAFEAVCVLCQYKIENEVPLFDVLIQAVIDADNEDDSDGDLFFFSDEEDEENYSSSDEGDEDI